MTLKMTDPVAVVATKVGLSQAIGYRLRADPTLLSQKKAPRSRRRSDPLGEIFKTEVLSLLKSAPGLRPVAIFEELQRRYAELTTLIYAAFCAKTLLRIQRPYKNGRLSLTKRCFLITHFGYAVRKVDIHETYCGAIINGPKNSN